MQDLDATSAFLASPRSELWQPVHQHHSGEDRVEQLPLRGSLSAGDGSADVTISTVLPSDVGPGGEAAAAASGVEDGGSCLLSFSGAARVAGRMLAHELRTFETDTEVVTAAKQRWS
eukprot:SAG25_NODE_7815_length_457_cov_0.544693_1_plen_116_part_01